MIGWEASLILEELAREGARLFAKSEFGPVSDWWPALSFSSKKVASDFANTYRRSFDLVIYVGTSDPTTTKKVEHRQRILSAIEVEPRTPVSTRDLIPEKAYAAAVREYGQRWEWSLPIAKAFEFNGFPSAYEVMPETYSSLGWMQSRGRAIPVMLTEYPTLLQQRIQEVELQLTPRAKQVLGLNIDDKRLNQEITRITDLMTRRIAQAGQTVSRKAPPRSGPIYTDLFPLGKQLWEEQKGRCALCNTLIPLETKNKLLRLSPDRIQSDNPSYGRDNLQLTHYGCNVAKNDASAEEWRDFLIMVRSPSPEPAEELMES